MDRAVDALVTGFTRSPELLIRSLAPLRQLKREGIIRRIHCVTWNSAELDECVAPLHDFPDVQLTRVPQPEAKGAPNQKGVIYQIENLKAALALIPDDTLVLKWRPDFVARYAFLRDKIVNFSTNAAVPSRECFGINMPPPAFKAKLWIPWADSNSFFFFEDAVFLGERRVVALLTQSPTSADLEVLGDAHCGSYAHVMRYAKPFLAKYPLFASYIRRFRCFRHDFDYRSRLVPFSLDNGFFWHMIIAHAWILHSQFHVDVGAPGDLRFYANAANRDADWSRFETLRCSSPYDNSITWRDGTKAGEVFPSLTRAFGRLMDDAWQRAIFTVGASDLPRHTLTGLMTHIAHCSDGRLGGIESEYYNGLDRLYRAHQAQFG